MALESQIIGQTICHYRIVDKLGFAGSEPILSQSSATLTLSDKVQFLSSTLTGTLFSAGSGHIRQSPVLQEFKSSRNVRPLCRRFM